MPERETNDKHTRWFSVGKQIVSFIIGVVVASYFVGGARQRVHDLGVWKEQVAPRIERMDNTGTISFDLFHKEYLRTQQRQEEKIKDLEREVHRIERENLERDRKKTVI